MNPLSLLLPLLISAAPAHALQLRLTPSQLCAASDAVVVGEVTSQETLWAAGPDGGLERRAFVSVAAVVAGEAPADLEVVVPGGVRDGLRHQVEHAPDLRVDTAYVLFVQRGADGLWSLTAGEQAVAAVKPGAALASVVAAARADVGACDGK